MIEEWTPTTEQVRDGYAIDPEAEHHDPIGYPQWERYARRAFDRWLAAHDAELLERVADEYAAQPEQERVYFSKIIRNWFRGRAAQIRKEAGL
ncbi:hypothetical protein [Microbacterium terrisoli]|jgi:hypothetical protein|uniref:hypothetical protein n=1 Tax=Microbacterium terrisoli TaxID=3242192 RepID=UPI0028052D2A|nr:hypothetical protein [Microbacterium protaetiae]